MRVNSIIAVSISLLWLTSASSYAAEVSGTDVDQQSGIDRNVEDQQQQVAAARAGWELRKVAVVRALNEGRSISDADPDSTILRLDADTYVVSDKNSYGLYVASRHNSQFSKTWDEKNDGIESAVNCKGEGDIPSPQIGHLPDTRRGDHRFYVVTTTCWIAGIIHGYYLRIMQLSDKTVREELHGEFNVSGADGGQITLEGRVLYLHDLRVDKTFWRGGSGPVYDWRVYLGPDNVRDLGRVPLDAERHAIDELFDRVHRGKPTSKAASDQVTAKLKAYFATLRVPERSAPGYFYLGELSGLTVKRNGHKVHTCISFDPNDGNHSQQQEQLRSNFLFTMTGKGTRRYVTGVTIQKGEEACGGFQ
jgi:hypothetical protein